VVGAVHPQHRSGDQVAPQLGERRDRPHERLGVVRQRRAVAVALGHVLGPHRGAVECVPPEAAPVDRRRHPTPHDGVLEPEAGQDLGHLGHMTEHVGQVAHRHGPAEPVARPHAELQVAYERLAADEELVGQRVPGADGDAAAADQPAEAVLGVGAHGQVVVDDRQLPVEEEPGIGGVGLHAGEEVVEQVDQPQAERLERRVPLPVPVGVRDDVDPATCPVTWALLGRHAVGRVHQTTSVLNQSSASPPRVTSTIARTLSSSWRITWA
jgi:hypothetical protein